MFYCFHSILTGLDVEGLAMTTPLLAPLAFEPVLPMLAKTPALAIGDSVDMNASTVTLLSSVVDESVRNASGESWMAVASLTNIRKPIR
jgi:hypothetical protein